MIQPKRRDHPPSVWFRNHPVSQVVVVSERYDMTLSLLLLPDVDGGDRQW